MHGCADRTLGDKCSRLSRPSHLQRGISLILRMIRHSSGCKKRAWSRRLLSVVATFRVMTASRGVRSTLETFLMRHCLNSLVALSLCTTPLFAGGNGKVVLDTWDIAYLGDGKAGYIHTLAKE